MTDTHVIGNNKEHELTRARRLEEMAGIQASSGISGTLRSAVLDGQELMLMSLRLANRKPNRSTKQQAILAFAQHAIKLGRCAEMAITAGYPLQSVPTLRAFHERLSVSLGARHDVTFAAKVISQTAKQSDVPKVSEGIRSGLAVVVNEYRENRGAKALDEENWVGMINALVRLQGTLSDFAHPRKDAHGYYYAVEPVSGSVVYIPYADPKPSPLTIMTLLLLDVLQTLMVLLMVVEFEEASLEDWGWIVAGLERHVREFKDRHDDRMQAIAEYATWPEKAAKESVSLTGADQMEPSGGAHGRSETCKR